MEAGDTIISILKDKKAFTKNFREVIFMARLTMFNHRKLKGLMGEHEVSTTYLAKSISISDQSLRDKLRGKADFRAEEILNICLIFGISTDEIGKYFFEDGE